MEAVIRQPASTAKVRTGSYTIAWILVLIAAALNIVAYFLNWYEMAYFDEAIHAYTFFSLTLLVSLFLYGVSISGYPRHKALLVLTVLCVGLALGVFWEWGEWAFDHLSGPSSTIQGKWDTQTDLLMDGAGALLAALILLVTLKRPDA